MNTTRKHVWVCPDCWSELERYDHEANWTEADDEDQNVGYSDYGRCVECREAVAELGKGLFIENAIVCYDFTQTGINYTVVIPT